jgi:ribosomal protein S14
MVKKEKKIFKPKSKLAQKLTINKKWTIWRKIEMKNREKLVLNELKKTTLQSLFYDQNQQLYQKLNNSYKTELQYKISNMNSRGSISKQKNYCYYIGRSRSFNRDLFMARHTFRKFARFGMLPGFVKERC